MATNTYNPANAIPAPSPEKPEIKALTQSEVDKLLKTAKNKNMWTYNLIFIAVYTGMRRDELLGIRWKDVNLEDEVIQVRQTLTRKIGEGLIFKKPKNKFEY